jgi:hypothetical protein
VVCPRWSGSRSFARKSCFGADAAFAKPEIYEAPEQRGVKYAIRIPPNESLERDIAELLTRPAGRPSHEPVVWYKGFLSSGELEDGQPGGGEDRVPPSDLLISVKSG